MVSMRSDMPGVFPARGVVPGRLHGFTMIELMFVVAILVILLSIAGPDFRNLIASTRVKNASFDVFSSLTQARSEAVARNTTVTITPISGQWVNGWTITCDDATTCKDPTSGNPPLTLRTQDSFSNITITNAAATIVFNGTGRATAGASFSITAPNLAQEARNARCVTLDPSGRPVSKSGTCS